MKMLAKMMHTEARNTSHVLYDFKRNYFFLLVISNPTLSMTLYSKSGAISYKAQSQDEEALVRAAARLHMIFENKNGNILGKLN